MSGEQMINGQNVQRSVHLGVCAGHTDMQIQKYANTKYTQLCLYKHTNTSNSKEGLFLKVSLLSINRDVIYHTRSNTNNITITTNTDTNSNTNTNTDDYIVGDV